MKLFEFQAKAIFKQHNLQVPASELISNEDGLLDALTKIGLPCVLKSQVLFGGRGKKGLIRFVKTKEEAQVACKELFASTYGVNRILVEQAVQIQQEIYLSFSIDANAAQVLLICSYAGGVEIEQLAVIAPEKIVKLTFDLMPEIPQETLTELCEFAGVPDALRKDFQRVACRLYDVFKDTDAELVEVNPLFITCEGNLVCGDGKLQIDDNSAFRHLEYKSETENYGSKAQREALREGIPYLEFDGDIGLMCAGAGLTNAVYDLIHFEGGTVANYLEFGGPHYRKAVKAMELCLANESKVLLIVTFGTIARADVIADGIAEAVRKLQPKRPIICCVRGTNEEEATKTLESIGLECYTETEDAVRRAIMIAKGGLLT